MGVKIKDVVDHSVASLCAKQLSLNSTSERTARGTRCGIWDIGYGVWHMECMKYGDFENETLVISMHLCQCKLHTFGLYCIQRLCAQQLTFNTTSGRGAWVTERGRHVEYGMLYVYGIYEIWDTGDEILVNLMQLCQCKWHNVRVHCQRLCAKQLTLN
jgi:hypothetical protein